jgi:hypothetical protein
MGRDFESIHQGDTRGRARRRESVRDTAEAATTAYARACRQQPPTLQEKQAVVSGVLQAGGLVGVRYSTLTRDGTAWVTETFQYGMGGELLGSRFDFFAPSNPEPGFGICRRCAAAGFACSSGPVPDQGPGPWSNQFQLEPFQ